MSCRYCGFRDIRLNRFQYAFVAGTHRVEYLEDALRVNRPLLKGVDPHLSIHVTTREGYDDRATTESGMHHYPILVWKFPHSDVLPDPVFLRPFCVFGSAESCLRVPREVGSTHCVTEVAALTDEFCESVVVALTQLLERNTTRSKHRTHTRKIKHVKTILNAAVNTTSTPAEKLKTLSAFIPRMIDFCPPLTLRPGSHNAGLTELVPRLQFQVAYKASLEAVHSSSLIYGAVLVLGDDSGRKKTTHILIDSSALRTDGFTHKHRVAAIVSATTYAAWKNGTLRNRPLGSLASYRLVVGHHMETVVVSPPLDDLTDVDGRGLDPRTSHHAMMVLLGDVHDHVHVVAALGRADSALIPKLIGSDTDDLDDISTWLGTSTEREGLLRYSCRRLNVQLYSNQVSHILSINNTLVFFKPTACGTLPHQEC